MVDGVVNRAACRLIVDAAASGAWNMAVDEALLQEAAGEGHATLRFYRWSEPTLSIGYFQRCEDRRRHAPSRDCPLVRRTTGGGAILHDRELTYSVVLPASHPLARHSEALYTAVHRAFVAVLGPLLSAPGDEWTLQCHKDDSPVERGEAPFLCFQRRARGDLLLTRPPSWKAPTEMGESPDAAAKILGSAQRRRRGAILQHGSLLLETSPAAPELAGLLDLTGLRVSADQVTADFSQRLSESLDLAMRPGVLPDRLRMPIQELCERKYGWDGWNGRR